MSIISLVAWLAAGGAAVAATVVKTSNTDNLNLGTSWVGGVPPGSADIAQWDSTVTAANAVNLGATTNWAGIKIINPAGPVTFNSDGSLLTNGASGIDLSSAVQDLTLNCPVILSANQTWNVASGRTLTQNASITGGKDLTKLGAGILNLAGGIAGAPCAFGQLFPQGGILNLSGTVNETSKLSISGGGTLNWTGNGTNTGSYYGVGDGSAGTNYMLAGTATVAVSSGVFIGNSGTVNDTSIVGVFTISGGTWKLTASKDFLMGSGYKNTGAGQGIVTINGTGTLDTGTATGLFQLGNYGGIGTVNLDGGTLSTLRNISRGASGNGGTATFNFNGGTLKANGGNATFLAGLSRANVRNGGAVINDGGFAVTIGQGLLHSSLAGDNAIDGGLSKSGAGTLTLTNVSTYTGPTVVNQGTLVVPTSTTTTGAYSVANGAALGVKAINAGLTLALSSLTLGTTGASTLQFDNSGFANPAAALANTPSLTLNGTVTVNVAGSGLSVGVVTLLTYGTKNGAGSFVLGTLPAGITGTLVDTGTSLQLNISAPLVWRGNTGNAWDIGNIANPTWVNLATLVATNYTETALGGPSVTFDDTATGSTAPSLGVTVKPAGLTFSNAALAYSLTGAGKISGSTGLTKNGNGTVTIGTSNDFSGPINLNAGTVVLANGDNRLPANALTFTRATLNLGANNQSFSNITVPDASTNTITGAGGSLTLNAPGFTLSQSNVVLDLSGLGSFTYNQPASDLVLNGTRNGAVDLKLAATNWITANNLIAGLTSADASAGNFGRLHLGQVNVFNVTNLQIGGYKTSGALDFLPGLVNPTLKLRGKDGVSMASVLFVGYNNTGAMGETGTLDTSLGSLDALVNNVFVGYELGGSTANGTLIMNAGTLTANNLYLGWAQQGTPTFSGTFSQNGGLVTVQNIVCGTATVGAPIITSVYNLNGGLLKAQSIIPGNNTGGTYTRTINWTNGTIQNFPGTGLQIANVNINAAATNAGRYFVIDAGATNTVNASVNQGGAGSLPIIQTGPGTLDLQGSTDNSWLSLNVSNGVVLLDKASSAGVHAIGYGLYLNGGTAVLAGSGGDQIADPRVVTINSGTFDLNGQSETIGGLAGTGGTLQDALGGGTLTVNVAPGTNCEFDGAITGGNLIFAGGGTQSVAGVDSRVGAFTMINGGTLALGNGGTTGSLNTDVNVNFPGALAFNRAGVFQYAGAIYGSGDVDQNGPGTVVLTGSDTHTGGTWVNAGTLAVTAGATGMGGTAITIAAGATLDLSAAAGFGFNAGQVVGGAGTVRGNYTLSGGATNQGNLVINGSVSLQDGSLLNPGAAFSAGTMTVNGNVTCAGNNLLLYNLAPTTTIGGGINPLVVVSGTLNLGGAGNTPALIIHGTPASGTYTLATFGNFVGNPAALQVIGSTRYSYAVRTLGQSLVLVVTGNGGSLVWRGDGTANLWDATIANKDWFNANSQALDSFNPGDNVRFDDTSVNPQVTLAAALLPASLTVDASQNYTFVDGGGAIGGVVGLTKTNAGTLTIQNNNGFTGAVNLNGGVVSVATVALNGIASPLGAGTTLAFNGGAFQYTGSGVLPAGFNRLLTVGANGAVIDQSGGGAFFITNTISGSGPLTKTGSGPLILGDVATGTGSNSYSGITYVTNGQVQIHHLNALGSASAKTVVVAPGNVAAAGGLVGVITEPFDLSGDGDGNGALQVQDAGTTVTYAGDINLVADAGIGSADTSAFSIVGNISGAGGLTKLGANTLTLLGTNTFTGPTTITAGTLRLGNGLTNSTLPSDITLSSTLAVVPNTNAAVTLPGSIHGTGTLYINQLGGGVALTGTNSDWTGPVTVNAGDLWINASNSLGVGPKTVTLNNGTAGHPALHLNGTNGPITLTPDLSFVTSWVNGTVFNEAGSNAILGNFTLTSGGGDTCFTVNSGLLYLGGNLTPNTSSRGLILSGAAQGILAGVVADGSSTLRELRTTGTGAWSVAGACASVAPANAAAGTLLIDGSWAGPANALTGATLGGAGTIAGAVVIQLGATLSPAGGGVGTLTLNNALTFSGNLSVQVNKSLAQTSDLVVVSGVLTNTGGSTVTVANLGPALAAGDSFTLFSRPLLNGKALTIQGGGAGVVWTNKLDVDGSIAVLSVLPPVNTTPTNIVATVSGRNLNLSWPADHLGWRLQVQTNALNVGLSRNWFDWPNSTNVTSVSVPLSPQNPTVFLRLVYP